MAKRIIKLPTPDLSQPLRAQLLGQAIKARRTQSNLRLEDAAALSGVAKQTFQSIEHGHDTSKLGTVLQIYDALGIILYIKPWKETDDGWD